MALICVMVDDNLTVGDIISFQNNQYIIVNIGHVTRKEENKKSVYIKKYIEKELNDK